MSPDADARDSRTPVKAVTVRDSFCDVRVMSLSDECADYILFRFEFKKVSIDSAYVPVGASAFSVVLWPCSTSRMPKGRTSSAPPRKIGPCGKSMCTFRPARPTVALFSHDTKPPRPSSGGSYARRNGDGSAAPERRHCR